MNKEDVASILGSTGAYLTWEKLGVAVSSSSGSADKNGYKSVLTDATGYAKPGEIVAIMGPSGCGKSTLLDSLAGRLASNTRQTGQILINGHKSRLAYGTMAYMTQEQVLTWTLTVKETVYYSAELQLPKSMPKSEKIERADKTIREMGLQNSMNTRIGGWGIKGLSGGQKRRLSICLELLTHPKLLLLDEPMSGLDSASSYYVMSRIDTDIGNIPDEVIHVLAEAYKSSEVYMETQREIATLCAKEGELIEGRGGLQASFITQCMVLSARSFKNMYRDLGYYWLRLGIYIALGFALGTLFYEIGFEFDSISARVSMILFVSSFLTILAVGGFPSFVEET
ncbi:hypothetical protein M8C21_026849, partial [Ambrosia artemisiifolia]